MNATPHAYGPRVHLAGGSFVSTALARASTEEISRTDLLALVRSVYEVLLASALDDFPQSRSEVATRMAAKHPTEGVWRGDAAEDAESELALWRDNHEEYLRWFSRDYKSKTLESTRHWIRSNLERYSGNRGFALALWFERKLAGVIDLHAINWADKRASIGYWLGASFQGKVLMTKACKTLVDYAFNELGLNRMEVWCAVENRKSRGIRERLGVSEEGVLRQHELLHDRYVDQVVYAMLAEEWRTSKIK